jgi:ATP-binding cassette subfamily C exporter for protease/lipase
MGMRSQLVAHWSALREQDNQASLRTQHLSQTLAGVSKSIRYLQQGLVLGGAAWLVIQGELSLGSMIAANVLVMRVLAPIDQLTSGYKTMASFHAAARRLLGIAAAPESKPLAAPSLVHTSSSSAPGWHWQALSVNPRSGVLCQPTTHHVAAGTLTLVRGPSGVGKSLLVKGALGLLPLGWLQGTVQWVDPTSSQPSVLPSVGYLSQEVDLFTGTIAQNIARMGEANAELVLQAAQAAGLHSLIVHLPMGYQTPVGHAGQQLPGGIRQRVGLARALYGSPQLLVLDEPDAHLDDLGLAALDQAIQQAQQQGSTIVLISHRPAWARLASSVLTLTPSSS